MHFTVVFSSHESYDLSYSLVFIPPPVWIKGDRQILNLNPENPQYQRGGVRRLLEREPITPHLLDGTKESLIIVHPSGNGTNEDLATLENDLRQEGFDTHKFFFVERSAQN
jgi:hypothetical protein